MSGVIDDLRKYARELIKLNLKQTAADIDYMCAWLESTKWDTPLKNGRKHLGPDPAGLGTVDKYSNNCPIPYNKETFSCLDDVKAAEILDNVYKTFNILKSETDDVTELTAISDYKSQIVETAAEIDYDIDTSGDDDQPIDPDDPVDPDLPDEIYDEEYQPYNVDYNCLVLDNNGSLEYSNTELVVQPLGAICLSGNSHLDICHLNTHIVYWPQLNVTYPPVPTIIYKEDGTTLLCNKYNNLYDMYGNDEYYTEEELFNLGWHTHWRVYSYTGEGSVTICSSPDGEVLTTFGNNINIIGNPFMLLDGWQKIRFTEDNGTTIKDGYFNASLNGISFTMQCVSDDISYIIERLDVLMAFRYPINGSPEQATLGSSYCGILYEEERDKVHSFGLTTYDNDYKYGEIEPDFNNYSYEVLALYSNIEATNVISYDVSNIKFDTNYSTLYMYNDGDSVQALTWKLRITKISN